VPALAPLSSGAFWLAVATLVVFIPTQLGLEGTLTARPREINLFLLLLLAALLSVPLALEPAEAWNAWLDFAKVVTMFVVMVNVVRTESRLRAMFWLGLLVSVVLSVSALNDYRTGQLKPGADRIEGVIGGLFENPNDMALYLVTMIPLAVGLLFVARGLSKKMAYGAVAFVMLLATVVTFSRGGLLALACASFVLAWKIGRRSRAMVVLSFVAAGALFLVLLPQEFTLRLLSIFGGDADRGSAIARENLLIRSVIVSLRHPLLGVGMDNFHILSLREQVSHNAYTQLSADMGLPALVFYVLFMLSTLKRLRAIERETFDDRKRSRVYYLAVGLQASVVGYMVSSFFASVAYLWYIYYLVGYALCLHRLYEAKGAEVFRRVARARLRATVESDADEDKSYADEDEEVARAGRVLAEGGAARVGRYGV
jgi:putative inorganic carbon (hco3(-)) transporter